MVVACEVQDFSNFLRVPMVSNALLKWDATTSYPPHLSPSQEGKAADKTGGGAGSVGPDSSAMEETLLSPHRPALSVEVEVHDAVLSISATAIQCLDQCIGEMKKGSPSSLLAAALRPATQGGMPLPAPAATSAALASTSLARAPDDRAADLDVAVTPPHETPPHASVSQAEGKV
ncbi:unnamed protein product, partial [Discosporangium mesarthrocarpum]